MAVPTSTNNPDEEHKAKIDALARALAEPLHLDHFQTEIDSLKENTQYIRGKLEELINAFNESVKQAQPQTATPTTGTAGSSLLNALPYQEKLGLVKEAVGAIKELGLAWKELRGNQPTTILDPEIINEHLKASMLGNFEVGEALTKTLKDKIIGKSMTKIVSEVISHEPA